MIITKKALPRRTFLRGAGAAIALPLLDAMIPAATAGRRHLPNHCHDWFSCLFQWEPIMLAGRHRG
ncbi:MAG: hypothetical protein CM1200mP40_17470 [Gammaproteobacteria bacterium]|nr:MAG: hypothetical protein CM1200mP40_17470 [Gammaproteobacteria bacterium]